MLTQMEFIIIGELAVIGKNQRLEVVNSEIEGIVLEHNISS